MKNEDKINMNTISTTNISSDESQSCDSKKSNANVSGECGFLSGEDENDSDDLRKFQDSFKHSVFSFC